VFGWDESRNAILNNYYIGIIYNANSFSSLIACYLVRLCEQFLGSCRLDIFSLKDGSVPPPTRKIGPYAYYIVRSFRMFCNLLDQFCSTVTTVACFTRLPGGQVVGNNCRALGYFCATVKKWLVYVISDGRWQPCGLFCKHPPVCACQKLRTELTTCWVCCLTVPDVCKTRLFLFKIDTYG